MKNCRANTAAAGVGVAAGTADSDILFSYLYRMDDDDWHTTLHHHHQTHLFHVSPSHLPSSGLPLPTSVAADANVPCSALAFFLLPFHKYIYIYNIHVLSSRAPTALTLTNTHSLNSRSRSRSLREPPPSITFAPKPNERRPNPKQKKIIISQFRDVC